jgi:Zn-dependent peptidase ImmA (M78 family)
VNSVQEQLARVPDLPALSAKAGIGVERLTALAAGAEASLRELRRLAVALGVSISSFASEPARERSKLLFRRATVAGKAVTPFALDQLSGRLDASLKVLHQPEHPNLWWRQHFGNYAASPRSPEVDAVRFREVFFGGDLFGPINSLPQIVADRMGVLLFVTKNSEFDGASAFIDGVAFAFVSARFRPRMLFTLAHEVGHLIAHHDDEAPFAIIDEDIENRTSGRSSKERYANAFASALLMPAQGFAIALKKVREVAGTSGHQVGDLEINLLGRIYGVSFWAAALRCEALALIPRGGAAALNERLNKAHGSAEKRAEEAGLPPRAEILFPQVPQPLLRSAVERIRSGELSLGRAAALLDVSISDLMTANAPTAH